MFTHFKSAIAYTFLFQRLVVVGFTQCHKEPTFLSHHCGDRELYLGNFEETEYSWELHNKSPIGISLTPVQPPKLLTNTAFLGIFKRCQKNPKNRRCHHYTNYYLWVAHAVKEYFPN